MRKFLVLLAACAASVVLWAGFDRPLPAPDWHGGLAGIAYNPSGVYSEGQRRQGYPEAVVREDLRKLSTITRRIRTYSVDPGLDRVPALAGALGMRVALGIWLSDDIERNEAQIARAIEVVKAHPQAIERVIVGNETLLRGELTAAQVTAYIQRVRKAIPKRIPVGTAEVWATWLAHPELGAAGDFIAIHLLPYWEGIKAADAMGYIDHRLGLIEQAFPGKRIVIGEAGWPSEGRVKKGSVPSPAMAAWFLRDFAALAAARHADYYAFEAYDQPWKAGQEGAVGAHWGLFDAERAPKFAFAGPLTSFPGWPAYALAAALGTLLLGTLVLALAPRVRLPGQVLLAGSAAAVASGALFVVDAWPLRYAGAGTLLAAVAIVPAAAFAAALLLAECVEWALALWRERRRPAPPRGSGHAPRVSIHVPIHEEPPAMVVQSLAALSRLDYPDFEVIVLDNNTRDDALWRPVAEYCRALGPRFRFLHLDGVNGYKGGALNRALAATGPAAALVAVIDSDYQVMPHWLKSVVPCFADPAVALVQSPQDYRDGGSSAFKAACNAEYAVFFRVGMIERGEENAIIQHGTMCVIRRSALEAAGGWAEWCITEDTELGLRLLEAGHRALYLPQSLGQGLVPDTFGAWKRQRYRWVYGAMQIMKRHAAAVLAGDATVMGHPARLTPAQRYHFLAGWLPWLADGLWLGFSLAALAWTALIAIAPRHFDVPLAALSGVALALFAVKLAKAISLNVARLGTGYAGAVATAATGLALACTVGKAVVAGLCTSSRPFLRTPKCEHAAPLLRALREAAAETALLAASVAAIAVTVASGRTADPAELVWLAVLGIVAAPYAAAVTLALVSATAVPRPVPLAHRDERVEAAPAYERP
ncbi:MAG: glycosyltransferase [Burkholderiales bacterium]|nr:glycosyltransferase [Burkholderiales bacterium]